MDLTQLKNLNWDLSKFTVDEVTTIKGELKKHGQHLQQQIQKMIQDYRQTDLDPEYLATASSDINSVEAKASNYLSMIKPDTKILDKRKWTCDQREKYKQECLIQHSCATGNYHFTERFLNRLTTSLYQRDAAVVTITSGRKSQELADRLTIVFEREWMDVHTAVFRSGAKARIHNHDIYVSLRDILKFCNDRCSEIASKQISEICGVLHMDTGHTNTSAIDTGVLLLTKEMMKSSVAYTLFSVQQSIKQGVKSQPFLKAFLSLLPMSKPPLCTYLDIIIEILWYMHIQEPSVHLEFSPEDETLYRSFQVQGSHLDFVIWPAVKLHKHGPVASKGVAQFVSSPIPTSDLKDDGQDGYQAIEIKDHDKRDTSKFYFFTKEEKDFYYFTEK